MTELEIKILNGIKADYFYDNPPVTIGLDREGQSLDDQGNFVLGCVVAGEVAIGNLLHEMGHFAEREPTKLLKRPHKAWGFYFGRYWEVNNQSGNEPDTDESTRREIRVWAYQVNLQKKYGLSVDIEDLVEAAKYVNSFWLYSPFKDAERTLRSSVKEQLLLVAQEVLQLSQTTFTLENFDRSWFERIKLLRD